ncbi:MAG: hypothetical protein WCF90_11145 [Methanomicrobiales archaeon]
MSSAIREQITGKCAGYNIALIGFASASSWNTPGSNRGFPQSSGPALYGRM